MLIEQYENIISRNRVQVTLASPFLTLRVAQQIKDMAEMASVLESPFTTTQPGSFGAEENNRYRIISGCHLSSSAGVPDRKQ